MEKFFRESNILKYKVDLEERGHLVASSQPDTLTDSEQTEVVGSTAQRDNEAPVTDRAVIIWMDIRYRVRNKVVEMTTAVRLYVDENGKVVRHEDLWHGKKLNTWAKPARVASGFTYASLFTLCYGRR